MSLVNDMLRDLEVRRAAPDERQQLGSIHAVDEAGAARRERIQRLRRVLVVVTAAVLIALALFVLFDRLRLPAEPVVVLPERFDPPPAAEAATETQLLDVLPQNDGRHFVLQLLLDRPVSYQRMDMSGSVSFQLQGVHFTGEARTGRIEKAGQTLSWRVEAQGDDLQVLLVGFGDQLDVADRLESIGDRSQLWLAVSLLDAADAQAISTPVAEPAEAPLPDWVTREAAPAEPTTEPAPAELAYEPQSPRRPVTAAVQAAPTGPQSMHIGAHQPDALAEARQALVRGDHLKAIRQLQALHQAQPGNPQVAHWLARAYLTAGDSAALLAWLPTQLQARPFDAELRELLARGQLLLGDHVAAIATLQNSAPPLPRNTTYHALLAALHQQVGDWDASAEGYRQLLAVRPDQGAWQLGLAIALEQLDQSAQAGRHYRLALQGQGLDDNARRFATERAGSLGGTQ